MIEWIAQEDLKSQALGYSLRLDLLVLYFLWIELIVCINLFWADCQLDVYVVYGRRSNGLELELLVCFCYCLSTRSGLSEDSTWRGVAACQEGNGESINDSEQL
ncbi:hypothetical protein Ddye_031170 [Dipteronia dyeriana]|uniref:Uncharacterized protein n=1 Tax=Dipteronia dyeriana TaxID=168575 RepID=A0AAD9WNF7_9ROSI|nr:hypothetical protein Ddye_031170 [Dipteronia dyeriana]